MKGMATVRLLRELERHTGRRIWELFDLIGERGRWPLRRGPVAAQRAQQPAWACAEPPRLARAPPAVGTSTGGLLAVALGLLKLDMDACDHIYKVGRRLAGWLAGCRACALLQRGLPLPARLGAMPLWPLGAPSTGA